MVRQKGKPTKRPRASGPKRVALMPASSLSSPLLSNGWTATTGLNTYQKTVNKLADMYGIGDEDPLDLPQPKKRSKRKPKITKDHLTLIKEGQRLQEKHRQRLRRLRKGKKVKRGGRSAGQSICFDKRTTLQSLLRKILDAKKPLTTWIK